MYLSVINKRTGTVCLKLPLANEVAPPLRPQSGGHHRRWGALLDERIFLTAGFSKLYGSRCSTTSWGVVNPGDVRGFDSVGGDALGTLTDDNTSLTMNVNNCIIFLSP